MGIDRGAASVSHQDYTVETLARLLQRTPQDVSRMTDRGKLPGRRVRGEWVFHGADVVGWIEQEIGRLLISGERDRAADLSEVARLQQVLRSVPVGRDGERREHRIVEVLSPDAIAVPFVARTRNSVFTEIVALAMKTGLLWDTEELLSALRAREDLYPTALENGVALLHSRSRMPQILGGSFLAMGISPTGVHFASTPHGTPTDIFFLIAAMDDRAHLQLLSRLGRVISVPGFLDRLRGIPDAAAAMELIASTEAGLNL
ncbi:MAG: PTS sugar transporter subunit IIA [Planctomycetia bacterium]|nr:PTS sugar transporter subunit IIA [Planctomycetia bacterium]